MPELPEVEAIRSQLNGRLPGLRLLAATLPKPALARGTRVSALRLHAGGVLIDRVERRGKLLSLCLANGAAVAFHLGMDGTLLLESDRATIGPAHGALLRLSGRRRLSYLTRRKLGFVRFLSPRQAGHAFSGLGPDALSLDEDSFAALLAGRRRIKPLLLDQSRIAGLGNILVDESLHRAGIHPLASACRLSAARRRALLAAARQVILESIAAGGSSIDDHRLPDGTCGGYQKQHRVYGRMGLPCPSCGAPVQRIVVATRGTHYCPRCQRR